MEPGIHFGGLALKEIRSRRSYGVYVTCGSLNIANLQSYSSREIPHRFPWAKMKIPVGLYSFLESVGGNLFP